LFRLKKLKQKTMKKTGKKEKSLTRLAQRAKHRGRDGIRSRSGRELGILVKTNTSD
jgi:hypothetical protein